MKKLRKLMGLLLCCVMLASMLPVSAFADWDWDDSYYNHIDVRVAGKVTFTSKVNGVTISSETVNATVSNVSGTVNGKSVSFYKKSGSGKENEWRTNGKLKLNPSSDTVVLTYTVSGKRSDGTTFSQTLSSTYSGYNTLMGFIRNCPGQSGYDIDISADYLSESFTTDVTVTKVWDDLDNKYNKRPSSIQVQLYADGKEYGKAVELNASNNWSAKYSDLPKYSNGTTEVVYTVDEVSVPSGYTKTIEGLTIKNTYRPETITISGTKSWDDGNNQDGIRPGSITVKLMNGNTPVASQVVTAANGWKYTFNDVLKYDANDTEIKYTVKEDEVTGYEASYGSGDYNIKNTHTPSEIDISVSKEWNDGKNQDGIRPNSVTVQLYAGGTPVSGKTLVLSAGNNWSGTFENLPEYNSGSKIAYTVGESTVTGYEADITGNMDDGFVITNTHEPETIDISGSKTWDDANDQDRLRPSSITVTLMNDTDVVESKTVTAADNWSWTFEDVPKYEDGKEITYRLVEASVSNYSTVYNGYNIKNTHTPNKVSVTVTKVWKDNSDQDRIRPEDVTIQLYADGKKVDGKTLVLSEGNNWNGSFTDLPENKDGSKIAYTVGEVSVNGYESEVTGNATDGFVITNTHEPETIDISGSKTWDDNGDNDSMRPESITIKLMKGSDPNPVETIEVTEEDDWSWTFADVPKYENGNKISYRILETSVDGYSTTYDGYNVKNTHTPEKVSVSVTKSWQDDDDRDNIRPESVVVQLYADDEPVQGKTLVLSEENNWTGSFTELAKYANKEAVVYSVEEEPVEGYESVVSGNAKDGFVITNSHDPERISVYGTKSWNDGDDQDNKRPDSIVVNLLKNGDKVDSVEVTEATQWTFSFDNLYKYEDGEEIQYTVVEEAVKDYTVEYSEEGFDITNSYTPGKISISVVKSWKDSNNMDKIRPKSVEVQLYANGEAVEGQTLTLTEADSWKGCFTDLPEYSKGKKIEYTVEEKAVKGYKATISGSAEEGFVITNSHTPKSKNPVTGDGNSMMLWLGLMMIAAAGIGGSVVYKKKRRA
ncbi:MAG: Cna B-type domain-containing protein [Clostridiales bacterium]|nr:Cna B-type domain-containing protein [Clostridiales bacterium]